MTGGRSLPPSSPWAGDDGSAHPGLAAALAAHGLDGPGSGLPAVVAALARARVLVPVLAKVEAEAEGAEGLRVDKEASTGVVALRAPDGRTALPVFSGTRALEAWRTDARPVPAEGPRAAASALQEGWELLVVDPAGPAVVVPRPAVVALATGTPWRPAVVSGRVDDDVRAGAAAALAPVAGLRGVDVVPGRRAEVAVVVAVVPGLGRAALDELLRMVGEALASDAALTERVDSVELRVVPAG